MRLSCGHRAALSSTSGAPRDHHDQTSTTATDSTACSRRSPTSSSAASTCSTPPRPPSTPPGTARQPHPPPPPSTPSTHRPHPRAHECEDDTIIPQPSAAYLPSHRNPTRRTPRSRAARRASQAPRTTSRAMASARLGVEPSTRRPRRGRCVACLTRTRHMSMTASAFFASEPPSPFNGAGPTSSSLPPRWCTGVRRSSRTCCCSCCCRRDDLRMISACPLPL